jgi:hypothetical protein
VVEQPAGQRFFPEALPLEYERVIVGQMATERVYALPELQNAWEQMRRGEWRGRGPNRATAAFAADGSLRIRVELKA